MSLLDRHPALLGAALHDPIVYAHLGKSYAEAVGDEAALIACVVSLSRELSDVRARLHTALSEAPPPLIIVRERER